MSQENVEIVRRAYQAFNRGDLDAVVANVAPDSEYVASGAIPGVEGVYRGPEGLKRVISWLREAFADVRVEVHDLIGAGDQVPVSFTNRGRGKQSGVEASWTVWQLWTLRDGKMVRGQGFTSREDALEAAGLED
jgi:ketosteroid isomerase-like protein